MYRHIGEIQLVIQGVLIIHFYFYILLTMISVELIKFGTLQIFQAVDIHIYRYVLSILHQRRCYPLLRRRSFLGVREGEFWGLEQILFIHFCFEIVSLSSSLSTPHNSITLIIHTNGCTFYWTFHSARSPLR